MPIVQLAPEAEADLADLWAYLTQSASLATADRVLLEIQQGCQRLVELPGMGRRRHFRSPELAEVRSWVIHRHVLFYRPTSHGIEVLRVIHGSRDLNALLGSED